MSYCKECNMTYVTAFDYFEHRKKKHGEPSPLDDMEEED